MKITFDDFEKAVREAKQYVNNYDKTRWKIVEIALRVCDTNKGGRKSHEVFSITKFALAIEIAPKTLMGWVRAKRLVLDVLPAVELKNKTLYTYEDIRIVSAKVNESYTPKQVLDAWREQMNIPLENKKFQKYIRGLDSIIYNAQRPLNMTLVDKDLMEVIIKKCDLISRLLNKELELREKFSIEKRMMGKTQEIEKALGEL